MKKEYIYPHTALMAVTLNSMLCDSIHLSGDEFDSGSGSGDLYDPIE